MPVQSVIEKVSFFQLSIANVFLKDLKGCLWTFFDRYTALFLFHSTLYRIKLKSWKSRQGEKDLCDTTQQGEGANLKHLDV